MPTEPRLAEVPGTGAQIMVDDAGAGVVRTSSGRFLRLQAPPPRVVEYLAGAGGMTATAAQCAIDALPGADEATVEAAKYVSDLRSELGAREARDAQARWPDHRRRVALIGAGDAPDDVAASLRDWQVDAVRHPDAAGFVAGMGDRTWDLVIAYADAPSQRGAWGLLDALPRAGTAWLRAYREGENCFVDPLAVTGDDPSSEQVLRRRIAASLVPGELTAWQRTTPPPRRPLPLGERALCVARILAVALAWAQDGPALAGYRQTLWKLVSATGTASEHPAIAYPPPYVPDVAGRT